VRTRLTIAGVSALLVALVAGTVSASAEPLPVFRGALVFPVIREPADPEEYQWEVQLYPGQDLRQVDSQSAAIYFEDETVTGVLSAAPARDARGTAVPTSLSVSDGNVVTLTVHHRERDPAKDGAPFLYPVTYGPAYEVGYSSVTVVSPALGLAPPRAGARLRRAETQGSASEGEPEEVARRRLPAG
jgi:hypothetical protein